MSFVVTLALALQVTAGVEANKDGVKVNAGVKVPPFKRIEVTDEHRRTAFKDPAARDLLLRARVARQLQDSALLSYEVKSYQRISVGMSLRETARDRLAFRMENASRVRWQRNVGAHVEVLGSRAVVPIVQGIKEAEKDVKEDQDFDDMFTIPYYPGKDELWLFDMIGGNNNGNDDRDEDMTVLIHPIAEGSEAYFTFETGDSVTMTLPDGTNLRLRELRVTPREAKWNLVVGSLWFEVEKANIVRAVMRFSTPMNVWDVARQDDPEFDKDVPRVMRPLFGNMEANLSALTIEYGLFNQRFWLPRIQGAEMSAKVSLLRVPVKIEQRYQYESVNAFDSLPAIVLPAEFDSDTLRARLKEAGLDSLAIRDSVHVAYAQHDSAHTRERKAQCDARGYYTEYQRRHEDAPLSVAVNIPCDVDKLFNSPDLPPSIYDAGEELFGAKEREELLKALDFGLQPAWAPQRPSFAWGLPYTRYNRVEGLSTGALVEEKLGKGYTLSLGGRLSLSDAQLNGDLSLARSNGRTTVRGTVYRRLETSTDFGDPHTLGASFNAITGVRHESYFHRAWGGELVAERDAGRGFQWRLFSEQQWEATVESQWSLFRGANDPRVPGNVAATRGSISGASVRWRGAHGLDPAGWRVSADLKLEGGAGSFDFGRAFVETIVSRGLGPVAASLTTAAGTSTGALPPQRNFFLGGLQTVRGQDLGAAAGEAFWLTRLEIGKNIAAVRPVIFGDLGWAGARDDWGTNSRPLAGAGIGASFLDGMIRVDLARGIHPKVQTRFDIYFEARF